MFRPRYVLAPGTVAPTLACPDSASWPRLGYCVCVTEQHRGQAAAAGQDADQRGYPGQNLGLPENGRGSVSGTGRKLGAIFIDWMLCTVIVLTLIRPSQWAVSYWTLAIFAGQDLVLTGLVGVTIGKRLLNIRVVRLDGAMVGLGWAALRTLLLLLVVPAVLIDRDQRGLHDRASNTAVVKL